MRKKYDSYKRKRFMFWLNVHRSDEQELAGHLQHLKQQRQFTTVIRQGVELVDNLRSGKVDFLLRSFPFVAQVIKEQVQAELAEQRRQLQAEREKLLAEQRRFDWLISQSYPSQVTSPVQSPLAPVSANGANSGLQPVAPMAETDDDEDLSDLLVVREAKSDGKQATANFLASMARLQNA